MATETEDATRPQPAAQSLAKILQGFPSTTTTSSSTNSTPQPSSSSSSSHLTFNRKPPASTPAFPTNPKLPSSSSTSRHRSLSKGSSPKLPSTQTTSSSSPPSSIPSPKLKSSSSSSSASPAPTRKSSRLSINDIINSNNISIRSFSKSSFSSSLKNKPSPPHSRSVSPHSVIIMDQTSSATPAIKLEPDSLSPTVVSTPNSTSSATSSSSKQPPSQKDLPQQQPPAAQQKKQTRRRKRKAPDSESQDAPPPPKQPATKSSKEKNNDEETPAKRKRMSVACLGCRARKVKCDGRKPRCLNCELYKDECTFVFHNDKRKPYPKEYIDALNSRIRILENLLTESNIEFDPATDIPVHEDSSSNLLIENDPNDPSAKPSDPSAGPDGQLSSASEPNQRSSEFVEKMAARVGELSMTETGLRYFGPTSNFHFLSSTIWTRKPTSDIVAKGRKAIEDAGIEYDIDPKQRDHLLNLYWTWIHPFYALTDKKIFLRDMEAYYRSNDRASSSSSSSSSSNQSANGTSSSSDSFGNLTKGPTKYFSPLLLYAMLAIASLLDDLYNGHQYHIKARILLDLEMEEPQITTVQAAAILGLYEGVSDRDTRGWIYSGMAIRMAVEMGYHLDSKRWVEHGLISEEEAYMRQITFWGCFLTERLWSYYLGRSSSIRLADVQVQRPKDVDDPIITNSSTNSNDATSNAQPSGSSSSTGPQTLPSVSPSSIDSSPDTWVPYIAPDVDLPNIWKEYTALTRTRTTNVYLVELAILNAEIQEVVYATSQTRSLNSLWAFASQMHIKLAQWYTTLPSPLLCSPNSQKPVIAHIVLIHLQYHLTLIYLHRPFMYMPNNLPAANHATDLCRQAALGISNLLARYHHSWYTLRRIHPAAVHMTFSAATVHLNSAWNDTGMNKVNATQGLKTCCEALAAMSSAYECAKRALAIITRLMNKGRHGFSENSHVISAYASAIPSGATTPIQHMLMGSSKEGSRAQSKVSSPTLTSFIKPETSPTSASHNARHSESPVLDIRSSLHKSESQSDSQDSVVIAAGIAALAANTRNNNISKAAASGRHSSDVHHTVSGALPASATNLSEGDMSSYPPFDIVEAITRGFSNSELKPMASGSDVAETVWRPSLQRNLNRHRAMMNSAVFGNSNGGLLGSISAANNNEFNRSSSNTETNNFPLGVNTVPFFNSEDFFAYARTMNNQDVVNQGSGNDASDSPKNDLARFGTPPGYYYTLDEAPRPPQNISNRVFGYTLSRAQSYLNQLHFLQQQQQQQQHQQNHQRNNSNVSSHSDDDHEDSSANTKPSTLESDMDGSSAQKNDDPRLLKAKSTPTTRKAMSDLLMLTTPYLTAGLSNNGADKSGNKSHDEGAKHKHHEGSNHKHRSNSTNSSHGLSNYANFVTKYSMDGSRHRGGSTSGGSGNAGSSSATSNVDGGPSTENTGDSTGFLNPSSASIPFMLGGLGGLGMNLGLVSGHHNNGATSNDYHSSGSSGSGSHHGHSNHHHGHHHGHHSSSSGIIDGSVLTGAGGGAGEGHVSGGASTPTFFDQFGAVSGLVPDLVGTNEWRAFFHAVKNDAGTLPSGQAFDADGSRPNGHHKSGAAGSGANNGRNNGAGNNNAPVGVGNGSNNS